MLKSTPEAISKIYFPGAAGPWSTVSELLEGTQTSNQHTGRICPRVVLSALPVCERDFQISLREGVGLPRLADKQTMANSVGKKVFAQG